MPLYEFRCRTCEARFEIRRSMTMSADPAPCPEGHTDTTRLLSMFAATGSASEATSGGCCGGACGCAG